MGQGKNLQSKAWLTSRVSLYGAGLTYRVAVITGLLFALPLLILFLLFVQSSLLFDRSLIRTEQSEMRTTLNTFRILHDQLDQGQDHDDESVEQDHDDESVEKVAFELVELISPTGLELIAIDGACQAESRGDAATIRENLCQSIDQNGAVDGRMTVARARQLERNYILIDALWLDHHVFIAKDISNLAKLRRDQNTVITRVTLILFLVDLVTLLVFLTIEFNPIRALTNLLRSYGQGDFSAQPSHLTSSAEVMTLYRSLEDFKENALAQIRLDKLDAQMGEAARIQRSILPTAMTLPNATIAADMVAAQVVGGDYYDMFWVVPNKIIGFAVADVSDKGVASALFGVQTSTMVRALAAPDVTPGDVLTRANAQLGARNTELMFTTLILSYVDLETGEMTYANAGHEPFFVLSAKGLTTPNFVTGETVGNPPLGVFEDATFSTGHVQLAPGETVLFYTDGANEARLPDGSLLGQGGWENMVRARNSDAPGDMIAALGADLQALNSDHLADDVTFVAFRYEGA